MKKFFLLFFSLASFSFALSQSVVSGVVIDGDFNEPLAFANVIVREQGSTETIVGAITDFEGRYVLNVEAGTYEIEFSYLGYETKIVSDVVVGISGEQEVSIVLNPSANVLEEVVVTTSARKNSEASVLAIQKGAVTLVDGLSAQTIRKSGDGNVASAIKRIPGVSIQGGKFVYVRGLGDRYSKTLLGGLEVPGLDPDRNTLQLDIFPTNLLDNILVSKSSSAEQGADFTGGVVDVLLRDFSALPEYTVSLSTSFNSTTNLKDAPALPKYALDPFFFDSGKNNLPFSSTRVFERPESINNPAQELELRNGTLSLTPQMGVSRENNLFDTSIGLTASNQLNFSDSSSIGYIASLNYKYDSDYYENAVNGNIAIRENQPEPFDAQEGELGTIQAIASGLFGVALKTGNAKHKALVLAIRSGESNAFDGFIQDFIENPYFGATNTMTHTERNIVSFPVSGSYRVGSKLSVDWKVAPSIVQVRDIDFRKTVFNQLENGTRLIDNSVSSLPQRLWRDLDETALSGRMDVTLDYSTGKAESQLKFGAAFLNKKRAFGTDFFTVGFRGSSVVLDGDYNNILRPIFVWNSNRDTGSFIIGEYQPTNQYESESQTVGTYISNEIKLSEKLKTIVGLRYEMYDVIYSGQSIEGTLFDKEEFISVDDFYPSLNVIYSFSDAVNLRGSYSKTTARPSFKENSAANIYDPITERFFVGNISLVPTYIDNYDLRWEKYGEGNEFMALSVFYKRFENPIEINYFDVSTPNTLIARNTEEATVYGAELEFRKNVIENENQRLSLNVNTSLIVSELTMSDGEFAARTAVSPDRVISNKRELQGQSPYLVNAGMSYNIFEKDLEVGAYFNVQGRALQVIGVGQFPDVFTEPFNSLNANLSKSFGEKKNMSASLKLENLLNDKIESRFDYFGDKSFVFSSITPGINASLGFSYKF